ncbi:MULTISPECIES: FAD-binding oxidoreductase [Legionellaceae]|jgi:NAD(P)H-flavin reductase/ferredoxin|uniref:Xylene monooxygenase electron transfer component n=1 Tax=Fluoribacter dumoffii TaxID=463 RepID=A0A377IUI3_9GAMM|nr:MULTISPECIES: FAD-binding oxidoreductase [Legionellaceae]MBN9231295.1 2Fe-2S iron-sulfur cluster binding domain-containing protein [Legionella sp.]MCA0402165.1 2Fe-2S iron-sulfur cluster binding domain-containing protein [Pseudomonadota bacterium]MBN9227991.1 2Fe-2S iron-sulfur cluster binding domain-containing protein [Legionella steelei]OJW12708.1 MAG: ferredoxin [Legionella sp. 39-23]STO91533.1 Xylene monooxygenase electron transfer component [Fluoribacter dumoffii]
MSTVAFNNQSYSIEPQESVLHCLLRHEVDYPNSCQAGICQSCLIKVKDGEINPAWQEGLPETLKAQGYFLACLAKPETPLEVLTPESTECEVNAQIIDINALNYNVMQVKLHVDDLEHWIPGQYLSLINPEGTIRSYSIANIPEQEGFIELHVKIYPGGSMGQWLANKATKHAEVKLRGPFGRCFYYNPEQLAFNMLLAGTGTGLAPLIAIIKSALSNKHQGTITLVHGGLADEDIYYKEELEMLSLLFPSFVYDACVLQSQGRYPEASIEQRALMHLNQPKETRVYVCGPKDTTDKLKKQIFLAGVPSQAILSDVFL